MAFIGPLDQPDLPVSFKTKRAVDRLPYQKIEKLIFPRRDQYPRWS